MVCESRSNGGLWVQYFKGALCGVPSLALDKVSEIFRSMHPWDTDKVIVTRDVKAIVFGEKLPLVGSRKLSYVMSWPCHRAVNMLTRSLGLCELEALECLMGIYTITI